MAEQFSMAEGMVAMHELFLSAMAAGFTEHQALFLIGQMLSSGARNIPPDGPNDRS